VIEIPRDHLPRLERRYLLKALVAVVGSALAVLLLPVPAWADATLVSSTPRAGETLTSTPAAVTLEFSEQLNRSFSNATVLMPDGAHFVSEPARDQEIVIPIAGRQRGVYTVDWAAVSAVDGHVLHGQLVFGVGIAPGRTGPLERTAPSPADVAGAPLRWLEYLGLIGTIGIMVVRRLAANRPRIEWARPSMELALAAAIVGGLGVITFEAFGAAGSLSGAITYLTGDGPGWVRTARVAAEGAALVCCLRRVGFVAPLVLFAAAALALAGHSAGVRPAAGAIFTDALHVLSAGVWAGGIIALAFLRPPGGWSGEEGKAFLVRFGRVAMIAFAITALTGVLRATASLGGFGDLWGTSYGLLLTAKSAGVLAMAVLSLLVWRRGVEVTRIEAGLAVLALAATALLAAYPLPPAPAADTVVLATAATSG
jgi:copper transport protein